MAVLPFTSNEVYQTALTTAESEASHARLAAFAGLQTGGLIAGGAGVLTGLVLWALPPVRSSTMRK